jgi:hypothetical protein
LNRLGAGRFRKIVEFVYMREHEGEVARCVPHAESLSRQLSATGRDKWCTAISLHISTDLISARKW